MHWTHKELLLCVRGQLTSTVQEIVAKACTNTDMVTNPKSLHPGNSSNEPLKLGMWIRKMSSMWAWDTQQDAMDAHFAYPHRHLQDTMTSPAGAKARGCTCSTMWRRPELSRLTRGRVALGCQFCGALTGSNRLLDSHMCSKVAPVQELP